MSRQQITFHVKVFFTLILLYGNNLFSQETEFTNAAKNTLKNKLTKEVEDEVKYLVNTSIDYLYINYDSAHIYADSTIAISAQVGYAKGIAMGKRQKGLIYYYEVKFTKALKVLLESKHIYDSLGSTEGQASALNMISIIYSDQGRNKEALELYHTILSLIDPDNDARRSIAFNNIGATYYDMQEYEKCYPYYLKAYRLVKGLNKPESESQYSNNIGTLLIHMQKPDSAMYYLTQGLEIAQKINNKHRLSNSYEAMGDYYYWQQDYTTALSNYKRAYDYAKEIAIVYEISSTASGLSKTYNALGNFKNAFHYLTIQKQMDDSIKQKEIASYITEVELEKSFQKERELNEAINIKNKLVKNIYGIGIIAILIIAAILFYSYTQKKKAFKLLSDYTEKVKSQKEEIQTQAEQLADLNTHKDKLFSIISHDLRGPLFSIVSVLQLTKRGDFTRDEFYNLLDEMLKTAHYTSELIENLLNWTAQQKDGLQLHPASINCNELAVNCVEQLNSIIEQKNLKITNTIDENHVVWADGNSLMLVLRNLISNAVKFSYHNSDILLSTIEHEKHITWEVSDFGVGMTKEKVSKLFGTEMESTKGTNDEKGTGLGLLLSNDFVKFNGGEITIDSQEGKGTTVRFTVPKAG